MTIPATNSTCVLIMILWRMCPPTLNTVSVAQQAGWEADVLLHHHVMASHSRHSVLMHCIIVRLSFLAYGRPLYAVALKDTFDVLVYTGSRWFNALVPHGTFGGLLKAKAPFHAFWDGYSIGEETTRMRYYSDPVGPAMTVRGARESKLWAILKLS